MTSAMLKMFRISPKCAMMLHTIYVYYAGTYGIFQKRQNMKSNKSENPVSTTKEYTLVN